jgi:hypothetical protein
MVVLYSCILGVIESYMSCNEYGLVLALTAI